MGYPCPSILQSLPVVPEGTAGTSVGKKKRMNRLSVKVKASSGFSYGAVGAEMAYSPALTFESPVHAPVVSGDVVCDLVADFDTETSYIIRQDEPYPLSILSVMPNVTEYN